MAGWNQMGRKSLYDPKKHPKLAAQYASEGLIEKDIAHNLGISQATLSDWKNKYPVFLEAIKKNKGVIDKRVESALLKRAEGYEYEETEVIVNQDAEGNNKPARIKKIKKQMAPDVVAQIFWLKNRKPGEWRDKQEIEHGNITIKVKLPDGIDVD